jgi:predicted aspartyl protease
MFPGVSPAPATRARRRAVREARALLHQRGVRLIIVECEVGEVRRHGRTLRIRGLAVDAGAEFSWLPRGVLARAGVPVAKKGLAFVMTDGRIARRSVGYAVLRTSGFETVDEVVFAEHGDLPVLGARTLAGFGAVVDVRERRLVAARQGVPA